MRWGTAIGLGQIVSLLITTTGVTSQMLVEWYHFNAPTTQSTLNYFLLSFYLLPFLYLSKKSSISSSSSIDSFPSSTDNNQVNQSFPFFSISSSKKKKWLLFFVLSFVDVEANYFVVKAYQYTSITSVMLLDCSTLPWVIILSYLVLGSKPNRKQIGGVFVSLIGIAILIISDYFFNPKGNSGPSHPILGDALCLLSALFYAISNVGQEFYMKKYAFHLIEMEKECDPISNPKWESDNKLKELIRLEWLSTIGIFGFLINLTQLILLERNEVTEISIKGGTPILLIFIFAICLFAVYSLAPYMMVLSSATMFNLSLLTSDAFAILLSYFIFHSNLSFLYFISLFIIVLGLIIYNLPERESSYHEISKMQEGQ